MERWKYVSHTETKDGIKIFYTNGSKIIPTFILATSDHYKYLMKHPDQINFDVAGELVEYPIVRHILFDVSANANNFLKTREGLSFMLRRISGKCPVQVAVDVTCRILCIDPTLT